MKLRSFDDLPEELQEQIGAAIYGLGLSWRERARRVIHVVIRYYPDEPLKLQAITAAYPWGERRNQPYKGWCLARKDVLEGRRPQKEAPTRRKEAPALEGQLSLWDGIE